MASHLSMRGCCLRWNHLGHLRKRCPKSSGFLHEMHPVKEHKVKFSKQSHHPRIDFYFHLSQGTQGDIWLLNDCHRTLSVPCGSEPLQMSSFLAMGPGRWPRCTSIPIFQLQTSCFFLRACRTHFPCFFCFHRPVSLNSLSRAQKLWGTAVDTCTSLNW